MGDRHYDREVQGRDIVLLGESRVHRDEHFKLSLSKGEQVAVGLTAPTHLLDCANFVALEFGAEATRQAFIEQDAHGRGGLLWPVPMRALPGSA